MDGSKHPALRSREVQKRVSGAQIYARGVGGLYRTYADYQPTWNRSNSNSAQYLVEASTNPKDQ